MHLPKSWSEIDVFQFKEIRSLYTIEETFTREIEILATLADIPSDDLEDLDISEVGDMLKDITFINSEPSKFYKHVLGEWKFKPLSKLTVGEFIDLEYFFANDYIKHISHVASILYRKHSINEWGDLIFEPYKYSPFERSELFDEYCINEIYGIITEYLAFRTTFMEKYELLFQADESEDEEEAIKPANSQDAKAEQEHKSAIKWSWERLLYGLCNEDLTKFDQVTDMPLVLTFNMMAMKKELNI
jgi:hypothetical protein